MTEPWVTRFVCACVLMALAWIHGHVWARSRMPKPPAPPEKPHECLGVVIRCIPHAQRRRDSYTGHPIVEEGTLCLLRCGCGKWITQWIPGTWVPEDFTREAPINMDAAISALTQEKP